MKTKTLKMEIIKNKLLNNWHIMRWLRLAMGVFIAFQAVQMQSPLAGLIAGILLFQTLMNIGCCGTSGCEVNSETSDLQDTEEVAFEEIERPRTSK